MHHSVDNLGGGSDHPHIDVSDSVLCFCTERWFTNYPCLKEVVRAVLRKKPIIALLEPDTSEQHGGLTEAQCRQILRGEMILNGPGGEMMYSDRLQRLRADVDCWSEAWVEPVRLPTAKEVEDALFQFAPIVWSPLTDFQDVSLRMIAERLLPGFEHLYGAPYEQIAYKKGELEHTLSGLVTKKRHNSKSLEARQSAGVLRQTLGRSSAAQRSFHLYCSNHSPRSRAVAEELASLMHRLQLPELQWTDDPEQLEECEHMLVHLDGETWSRGPESNALAHEVCKAMRAGVHRLLVHEVPGARLDDEWRRGCSFDHLMNATPEHLLDAGIYSEIAMNLAGGAWRTAGLAMMAKTICKFNGGRKRWKVEPNEPEGLLWQVAASSAHEQPSQIQVESCWTADEASVTRRPSQMPSASVRRASQLPPGSAQRPSRSTQPSLAGWMLLRWGWTAVRHCFYSNQHRL